MTAAGVMFTVAALAGCKGKAPDAMSHLPTDADTVVGVDLGRLAAWSGVSTLDPIVGTDVAKTLDGVAGCGVDVAEAKLLVASKGESDIVAVLTAPKIGTPDVLRCIGVGDWRESSAEPVFTPDDDGTIEVAGFTGRPISDDQILLTAGAYDEQRADLAEGTAGPEDEAIGKMLSTVDYDDTAWIVTSRTDESVDWMANVTGLRVGIETGDELSLDAMIWNGDAAQATSTQASMRRHLATMAGWVYAPPRFVDEAQIELEDTTVSVQSTMTLAQWKGMDLRYIAERRHDGEHDADEVADEIAALIADSDDEPAEPAPEVAVVARAAP